MGKLVTIKQAEARCAEQPGLVVEFPWGATPAVYKLAGKVFAFLSLGELPPGISVKVDPEDGVALRAQYNCVIEGYHQQTTLGHSLVRGGDSQKVVSEVIVDSYVCESLPRKIRESLA